MLGPRTSSTAQNHGSQLQLGTINLNLYVLAVSAVCDICFKLSVSQMSAQKSPCEVQTGKLGMFLCHLEVRTREARQASSSLFLALPLTHQPVTLDHSTELSGPIRPPQKDDGTGSVSVLSASSRWLPGNTVYSSYIKGHNSLLNYQAHLKFPLQVQHL